MWIFLNDAFFSVVAHRRKDMVLARARKEEDLRAIFPEAIISHTPKRDYAFRCVVKRSAMKKAMAAEIDRIDYDNFKNSVADMERHDAYSEVWGTMYSWARGGYARPRAPERPFVPGESETEAPWLAEERSGE